MTHLEYLKQNAESTRTSDDGKHTMYKLKEGVAVYDNYNDKYLWYSNPQPWSEA